MMAWQKELEQVVGFSAVMQYAVDERKDADTVI